MLIILKSPINSAKVGKNEQFFFKTHKIMVFEILIFGFHLEEKRQLQTTVYMNASTS